MYNYEATIIRWVDGDTVQLDVDLGFRIRSKTMFRMYGIDTPERGKPGYAEATYRAFQLAPPGTVVDISTHENPDKYGRWLVEIVTKEKLFINEALLNEGFATSYFGGTK